MFFFLNLDSKLVFHLFNSYKNINFTGLKYMLSNKSIPLNAIVINLYWQYMLVQVY